MIFAWIRFVFLGWIVYVSIRKMSRLMQDINGHLSYEAIQAIYKERMAEGNIVRQRLVDHFNGVNTKIVYFLVWGFVMAASIPFLSVLLLGYEKGAGWIIIASLVFMMNIGLSIFMRFGSNSARDDFLSRFGD